MLLGLILAVIVGITLGLVGSGGTILTVPILVYAMGVNPVIATTYSLFAIGATAVVGGIKGFYKNEVDLQKVITFGLPSLLMVFIVRNYMLSLVPEVFVFGSWEIHREVVLMILFALVMIASSYSMISGTGISFVRTSKRNSESVRQVVAQGLFVGFVTGVVGAGGGFLIIPTLVSVFSLPMKKAVSTSLVIIAINSAFGLLGDLEKFPEFDWYLLLSYTFFTIGGIFIGFFLSNKMDGEQLKKSFGYLILIVGIFVLLKELWLG